MSYRFSEYRDLRQIPTSASLLFAQAELRGFDQSLDWYINLVENGTPSGADPLIATTSRDDVIGDVIEAIVPFFHYKANRKLEAMTTFYSSVFRPCLRDSDNNSALVALFTHLRSRDEQVDEINVNPLPFDESIFSLTASALKISGWKIFPYFCFGNWFLPVQTHSYADYLSSRPSALKNTLKRKTKKFEQEHQGRIELVWSPQDLSKAIEIYTKIYESSWKVPEPFPNFMPGMMRLFAEKGQLRLGIAYVKDQPVAAQIWIVSHGCAAIYKLAYDEKYANLSAGTILTSRLMQHVMDVDKVSVVDYLVGDDNYKRDWMTHRRERWGIVAYNPSTLRGLTGACVEWIKRKIKRKSKPQLASSKNLPSN